MSKTLVSIISAQTIPNVLFIKEMFEQGDKLMFISSQKMSANIDWILNALNLGDVEIQRIVFENTDDEERWDVMCEKIKTYLSPDEKYLVNLTGGTKYMDFAVSEVFEKYDSSIYIFLIPRITFLLREVRIAFLWLLDCRFLIILQHTIFLSNSKILPKQRNILLSFTRCMLME